MAESIPDGERVIADQIAYYRARAPEYDETFGGSHDPELISALGAIQPGGDVLELACGTGVWTEAIVGHAVTSVHCVDAAPEMLALHEARIRDARVTREVANLFDWRPSRRYDLVTCGFWLSHVPPARFAAFWRTMREALASGGRVFLVDEDERGLAFEQPGGSAEYPTVERELLDGRRMTAVKVYYRADELRGRLDDAGWDATVVSVSNRFLWALAEPRDG